MKRIHFLSITDFKKTELMAVLRLATALKREHQRTGKPKEVLKSFQ